MAETRPLMQMLLEAGYPREEIFHHYSDLYVYSTPLTERVIDEWCKLNKYSKEWHCPTFRDQITGRKMRDCAFQYIPELLENDNGGEKV